MNRQILEAEKLFAVEKADGQAVLVLVKKDLQTGGAPDTASAQRTWLMESVPADPTDPAASLRFTSSN